jgi:hypothetical protein
LEVTEGQMNDLRRYLRSIYDVCECADADGVSIEFAGTELGLRRLFEIDITAYLLYLTASDTIIAQEEIDFVNELMGRSYSIDECTEQIERSGLMGNSFDNETPLSFKLLVDYTRHQGKDISDTLMSFYDALGVCIANIDNEYVAVEDSARRNYIYLLRGYKELGESTAV